MFIEHCKALIGIDSTPSNGNVEMALYCANLCREAGLQVHLQEGVFNGKAQYNLIARPPLHETSEEVLFQTHLDTVEPGPHGRWTMTDSNPFRATITGDTIYGLGSADVKLDFLCKLEAMKKLKDKRFQRPFVLVGTFAEEVGMVGAKQIINTKAVQAKMAIIGEPSELQIVYANNGFLVSQFWIPFSAEEKTFRDNHASEAFPTSQEKVFHGKAAHSSTPHLGDNAIFKLVDYLSKLPQGAATLNVGAGVSINTVPAEAHIEIDSSKVLKSSVADKIVKLVREVQRLDREFLGFNVPDFNPSHPTSNVALLRTDKKGVMMEVSFRLTPNVTDELLDTWMGRLTKGAQDLGCEFKVTRLSPPAYTKLDSELIQGAVATAKQLGLSTQPITKASGTECSVYSKHGIDCFVFGPGKSVGNSHTANEHNFISHLEKAKAFYFELLQRFCL